MALVVNPTASAGDIRDSGLIPGMGWSLEEEMATCSSFLALTYKLEKNYIAELLLHRKIRPQRIRPWRPAGLTFKKARGLWEIDSTPKAVLVAQSCPTLCNPMYRGLPGSSVHGILQARMLEWIAIPFSRGSFRPGIEPGSSLQADSLSSELPGRSILKGRTQ